MYDDDDGHDDGDLGGMVWFQMGRWSAQREREIDAALDNLNRPVFSYQPNQTLVDTNELNALIAERDRLYQQNQSLRRQVAQHEKQHEENAEYAISLLEEKLENIDFLERIRKLNEDSLKKERERCSNELDMRQFMTSRWFDMINFAEHGLVNEPEFRELTELTKSGHQTFLVTKDIHFKGTSFFNRMHELTEILEQKCKK